MDEKPTLNTELAMKVAKNLQAGHSKQTNGDARKWRDVPADEKKLWLRLARTAARLLASEPGVGA